MKASTKILYLWLGVVILYSSSMLLLPHKGIQLSQFTNNTIQSLLFFIVLFIFVKEPNRKNKMIFFNFLVFFGLSFYAHLHNFIGTLFLTESRYANLISFQYHSAAYALALSFSLVYIVIDLLFNHLKIAWKYVTSGSIVLFFFIWHFLPILSNPMYLYNTEDIKQWKTLSTYVAEHGAGSSTEELAGAVNLKVWRAGQPVGELYPEENIHRINALEPYLEGDNWGVLFLKPLYLDMVYMDAMLLFFMLLFFGYQYEKDPPQGAYLDKIMFIFLLFVSTEILHYWGYMKSVEWNLYLGLFNAGQYITIGLLSTMVVLFGLRLRFISSVTGEFYEAELASNPNRITRWKDGIDTLVLSKFYTLKPLRLFHSTGQK